MPELEVVLFCPNPRLLTEPWNNIVMKAIPNKNSRHFVSSICSLAKDLGEINRFHSKNLPDKYVMLLQSRMTKLRRVIAEINKDLKLKNRPPIIPIQHLEYLFSGEERKDMKR